MTRDAQSTGQDGDRLDSWKQIAAYLGKDVRTALRWSKNEGMPVYRHADSKRGAVYAYRSEIDEWIHSDRSAPLRAFRKPIFVGATAFFALILVSAAAILSLEHSIDKPIAPAGEPTWVLITNLHNQTGEARFDGTVETALRRELANSSQVLAAAPERVRATLALMRRQEERGIDAELGREICQRYGGKCAVLTGRVEKFESNYLLSLEVVDPTDGRRFASTAEEAAGEAMVPTAVARLGDWLRNHLSEELVQAGLSSQQLEQVTTPSLRALELYSIGMQAMYVYRWAEAEAIFRQAVKKDPEFASANLFVFWALYNQGRGTQEEAQSFLKRAMELAGSTSEQERIFIEGTYYGLSEKNFEKACESYKILAEFFPDHYWAAGNAVGACGDILGYREDYVRYAVQAAEFRVDSLFRAAESLTYLARDFDRARPFVDRLSDVIAGGGVSGGVSNSVLVAFTEFYAAEELFSNGMLADVATELQRLELVLKSTGASLQPWMIIRLINFHLALGQFGKVRALGQEKSWTGQIPCWMAFMDGDQVAFSERVEDFHIRFQELTPDPTARLVKLLGWNMRGLSDSFPLEVLVPLFEPDSVVAMTSAAEEQPPEFLSWPKFEAKFQLARGKQLLNQGQKEEAISYFKTGVSWFRDYGDWTTFSYYFLGVELLAATLYEQGDLLAAYFWLSQAADQRHMVNSYTASLYQRIQAQQALLARELGRTAEAESIEAELLAALSLADPDHAILVQIREQQDTILGME